MPFYKIYKISWFLFSYAKCILFAVIIRSSHVASSRRDNHVALSGFLGISNIDASSNETFSFKRL